MKKEELINCLEYLWHACRLDAEYEEINMLADHCLQFINEASNESLSVRENEGEKEFTRIDVYCAMDDARCYPYKTNDELIKRYE